MPNIVEIAVNNDAFKTLVTAVKVAGLVEALQQPGPLTVFAPNDDAFGKLLPGTVDTLVQNIPQLQRILKYHVVAGAYTTSDLQNIDTLTSLEGSPIPIRCGEPFEVKNATVLAPDIEASNGIIHVIDTVILMG
ncbi:fasciclin domain-containing protein [Spirulina sp. 06S082]|uniref:fasciclin domain-containing protein n=1 Tax=Spirulina sp. 06S082 TaxID=3110248 RepID=UPI002B1EB75C|nr:fasciclin domain-containing protein [Spirulina sp. 06S082]MEA5472282.1 fasciclin domain-containing protein [Spirulina sp. 06S082]